jgi:type IV fimbrial biogenesis protein FimT
LKHLSLPPTTPSAGQRGFTLVELVVTIALVAILTTLAIPSFTETLRGWRRDSATRAFVSSLNLARTEAIKTSRVLVVCPSADGASCSNASNWNIGWLVFSDDGIDSSNGVITPDNANNQSVDAGERVAAVMSAPAGVSAITSPDNIQLLQFLPNALMISGAPETEFIVTPEGATSVTKVNKINVSRVGRVSIDTELP